MLVKQEWSMVLVINGQDGGIDCALVEGAKTEYPDLHVRANTQATSAVLKSGCQFSAERAHSG